MKQLDTIFDANVRAVIPLVTSALVSRYGNLADCEDAVQEALLEASVAWAREGLPRDVRGWLLTVARRRYIDAVRSDAARRAREERDAALETGDAEAHALDDSLALLVLCCHPALQPPAQIALTLRAVCGLTTRQIAGAFYVSEATMAQRITRAKRTIDAAGRRFGLPGDSELAERSAAVRTALYLMFNEGYAPREGSAPVHSELVREAIRLGRMLHRASPTDTDTTALLALMLLTDARTATRSDAAGSLVALPDQDRRLWDQAELEEGRRLAGLALAAGPATPLVIQAAIAAVHAAATRAEETDWRQILGLYDVLVRLDPGPAARLGRAVAVGMVSGPLAGLAELSELEADERLRLDHRLVSVKAALLERAGALDAARDLYAEARDRTGNQAEREWLALKAQRLETTDPLRPSPEDRPAREEKEHDDDRHHP
ncbi:RNA polymerase sigma factor [Leifsonia xyli]|uniref:RNA polymerase sigma factor n=1 Tax=Leifsonia xyli TaxID=1575 RepID=UPI003D66D222